jgi:hypothetical protein
MAGSLYIAGEGDDAAWGTRPTSAGERAVAVDLFRRRTSETHARDSSWPNSSGLDLCRSKCRGLDAVRIVARSPLTRGVTAYDAAYQDLERKLPVPLATFDCRLWRRAATKGPLCDS